MHQPVPCGTSCSPALEMFLLNDPDILIISIKRRGNITACVTSLADEMRGANSGCSVLFSFLYQLPFVQPCVERTSADENLVLTGFLQHSAQAQLC